MTTEELDSILPAVKYRVRAKHVSTPGRTTVSVPPALFVGLMKPASVGPRSTLRDAAPKELGKATDLTIIRNVTTFYVEFVPSCSVPAGHLQAHFKSRRKNLPAYNML